MLERSDSLPCQSELSASLQLKADEASFCMRQDIIALKREEIMTNSKALGRIRGHLADSIFSYSLSGRCSSRAVSGGRALSAEPPTQLLLHLLVLLVPLLAKSRLGCFCGEAPWGGGITGRVMCVNCKYRLTQFYLQKSPYFHFGTFLSIAATFSRFAPCFCPTEQFPCVSGADFCVISLFRTLFWPCLACSPVSSVQKRSPHHLMLLLWGLGLSCLTFLARSQPLAVTLVSLSRWLLVFFVDSEKDWKTLVFNPGERAADLLSVDSGGSKCSAQCSSLLTFRENRLSSFCSTHF